MIDARTRMLSAVYDRHSDRMSAGILFAGKGLTGWVPPPVGAGIDPASASGTATITRTI
jgi:hypothetical protein